MAAQAFAIPWLALLLGGAPEATFPEIWYREVMLGDVAGAAAAYETLYLKPSSGAGALETRLKAAFRAAECFERIGERSSAALAYSFLRRESRSQAAGSRGGALSADVRALSSEAALRLSLLRERDPELSLDATTRTVLESALGSEAALPADASASFAVRALLAALGDRRAKLEEALVAVDSELSYRRERHAEHLELLSRLARRGAFLAFPEDPAGASEAARRGLAKALAAFPDAARLQAELGRRALERAFRYFAAGSAAVAREDLGVAKALLPDSPAIAEWERLQEGSAGPGVLGALAYRLAVDEDLARRSGIRREVREAIEGAEALVSERGRADLAVRQLSRAREALDWAPPAVREDVELRDLAERAGRWLDCVARSSGVGDALQRALQANRTHLENLLALSEELAGLLLRQAPLEGAALETAEPEVAAASRAEWEAVVHRAREALGRGDRLEAQRWIRDAFAVLDWVPALDPRGEHRARLESLRRGEPGLLEAESRKPGG